MKISVVVGSVESERSIRDCIASILSAGSEHATEVIVVDASRDATAALVRLHFPDVTLISMPSGTLTPRLWSEGFARSSGSAVAFTTGHCIVPAGWLGDLQGALALAAVGAGGPILLERDSSLLDAAIYFLRYSAFMPDGSTESRSVTDIAGDNCMYVRAELAPCLSPTDAFWEVDVNRRLTREGKVLTMVPSAAVSFGRSFPFAVISRHRFEHGIHSGRWRSTEDQVSPWRIVTVAPVVPFVLLLRIIRRVRRAGGDISLVVMCSPLILWLAMCWAAGEARGAWRAVDARRN
ncbi:MAG TPA: glycosyltransferase [Gemmatimonadaceae bacterium]